jgi:SAM-dependent methyltransferase
MEDPIEVNRRLWDERATIHMRDVTGFYRLDRIRAGEAGLHPIEEAELGDIRGKDVLHLQCHIGTDTLRLAARGARVTGLDFSEVAVTSARRLAKETGFDIRYIQGRVEDAPRLAPGPFDLVYTSWGTIAWLRDIDAWGKTIAAVLKPEGELYFADAHPGFLLMEEEQGKMVATWDFDTASDRPVDLTIATTYNGDPTILENQRELTWIHPISAVLGSLIGAGMALLWLHEHEILAWRGLPMLVPAGAGQWRLPDGHPRFPLSYSLRARKAQGLTTAPS